MQVTRLGVGGPGRSYGTFADKGAAAVAAITITGLGVGGPGRKYGVFSAKAEAEAETGISSNEFLITARRRGRR